MPKRTRMLAVAIVAAAVLAGMIVMWRTGASPAVTAADGRRTSVQQVTYGTEHRFTQGKLWVRCLKPLLGTRWAARHGCFETRLTSTNPVLMVWTRWSGVSKTNPLPVEATVLDEHGTESEIIVARWNQSDWWAHSNRFESTSYVAWMFQNYPRRERNLRLRIYDRDKEFRAAHALDLPFGNRGPKRHPQWTGHPLPISQMSEGWVFILHELEPGTGKVWHVRCDVTTNGVPDWSWQIGAICANDATGNFFHTRSNVSSGVSTNSAFALRGALWPDEQAWKLSVEFCRGVDFSTHELWTTPAMSIQTLGSPALLAITNSALNNSTVIVRGPETATPTIPLRPRGMRPNTSVRAWLDPTQPNRRLFLLRATDDLQRELECEATGGPGFDGWQNFGLVVSPGTKSLRFTFAVRESKVIEFDVLGRSVLRQEGATP